MPPAPTRCIGREHEMDELLLRMEAARQGEQLVIVEGPSGSGKSYLLQAFRTQIRLTGGVVLEGRCEDGTAFGPFAAIVEDALGFLGEMGSAPSPTVADLGCSGGCHPLWHQHPHHSELDASANSHGARERRLRFFDALRTLLQDVARFRPPVILLHDLERADAGTLQLLRFLFEGSGPWTEGVSPERSLKALFVASVRTDEKATQLSQERLAPLYSHDAATVLSLGPFGAEGVRAYLQSAEVVQLVLERTGGVPEAIELLLSADPLSPGAQLQRRLDEAGEEARALLEALAVLGHPSELDLVDEVVGRSDTDNHPLSQSPFVIETRLNGNIRYTFARARHRELLYAGLDSGTRTRLHRRCAEVFAARPGVAMAAHHALLAGDVEAAIPLALDEAQGLAARHAHAEAAALLERTARCLGAGDGVPGKLLESLADLHRIVGDYRRAIVHARTLSSRAPESAIAAHRLGRLLTLYGELEEAEVVLKAAQQLAEESGEAKTRTTVQTLLAELYFQRAAYHDAETWGERALEAALATDERSLEIHARNTLGKVALAKKEPDAAAEFFRYNHERAEEGLGNQRAQALTNHGVAMLRLQRLDEAQSYFEEAIREATAVGDSRELAIATENLAVLAHLDRNYSAALEYYHHAVAQLKRLGNRPMLTRVGINLGELYLSLGDVSRARSLCDFAQHMGGTNLSDYLLAVCLLLRGRVESVAGLHDKAAALFHGSSDLFEALGSTRRIDPVVELVRLRLHDGDVDGARQLLTTAPSAPTPKVAAELAAVGADFERAIGGDVGNATRRAVELARASGDPELLIEALLRSVRYHVDELNVSTATILLQEANETELALAKNVPEANRTTWATRPLRAQLAAMEAAVGAISPDVRRPSHLPAAQRSADHQKRYPDIGGSSAPILRILDVIDKVAPSDATVLVRGESGTGKELVADALHRHSERSDAALVKVNCAALVETLLLSELFGHERGAFTGANARKKGRFELANHGTLFLDEIGDISPGTQVALLRVLQEREFERVGGTQSIKVDVRIVAATHRDLESMVKDGTFREDLYYRLRGVTIEMPALRDRLTDMGELCSALLGRIAAERDTPPKQISLRVLNMLQQHQWPGNIRELENVLRSAALFSESDQLRVADFDAFSSSFSPNRVSSAPGKVSVTPRMMEDELYQRIRSGENSLFEMKKLLERECIIRALSDAEGNITKAAELLGMKRPRLSQLVKQYGLESYKKVQS